jgi:hypothetical protein
MAFEDLPVIVLQQIGAVAVQHAGRPPVMDAAVLVSEPVARRLDADDLDDGSSRKGWNRPMALEPPPTQR